MFEPEYKEFDTCEEHKERIKFDKKLNDRYHNMKRRCYNKEYKDYHNYGGRGIDICSEWLEDRLEFINWSHANGYHPDLELDRIDNNKGYSPDNCRYVDRITNRNNRRDSK